MSYEKHTWETGETITAEKLNHIEDGVMGDVLQIEEVLYSNGRVTVNNATALLSAFRESHPSFIRLIYDDRENSGSYQINVLMLFNEDYYEDGSANKVVTYESINTSAMMLDYNWTSDGNETLSVGNITFTGDNLTPTADDELVYESQ